MDQPTINVAEIARQTLRQLASRGLPPTPENYAALFAELSGSRPEHAVSRAPRDRTSEAAAPAGLELGRLVLDLLHEWERSQAGLSQLHKRQALANLAAKAPAMGVLPWLASLADLVQHWAALPARQPLSGAEPSEPAPLDAAEGGAAGAWRRLWTQSLRYGLLPYCRDESIKARARELLAASEDGSADLDALTAQARELWIHWERVQEETASVVEGLMGLVDLMLDHLVDWLGPDDRVAAQVQLIHGLLHEALNPEHIDRAREVFKELVYQQGVAKKSGDDAREAAKALISLVVRRLAEFADQSARTNESLAQDLARLEQSEDWDEIRSIVQDVLLRGRELHSGSAALGAQLEQARQEAAAAQARIEALEQELQQASVKLQEDPLTGALNRRGLDQAFVRETARAARSGTPLSVALLDLDHFKAINDHYGHDFGDQVLRALVDLSRRLMRPTDLIARIGGEEFLILLPDADAARAHRALSRLLQAFRTQRLTDPGTGRRVEVSFSAGVAEWCVGESFTHLYRRVDAALLRAKAAGRQRVELAEPCGG